MNCSRSESSEFVASRLFALVLYPLIVVVMPLFCIGLGFWVAAVRIDDVPAWLLLMLMLSISAFIGSSPRTMFGNTDALQPFFTGYRVYFNNLIPTSLVLFAHRVSRSSCV